MSTKAFKSEKISQMKEKIEKAKVAIVTDYKGLSVEEITKLRRSIQKEDGDYMVTKNTLAKIAVKGTEYEVLADSLTGPVAIAFGFDDQVAPAKALAKFIKETKKGEILAARLELGCLINALVYPVPKLQKQKLWLHYHQNKKFTQKCLVVSIHLHLVSQTLSMRLCLH